MKRIFYINFLLGSLLLLVMFLNLVVVSLEMTFGTNDTNGYTNYIVTTIVDIIYLSIIVIVNYKLIKTNGEGIKNIILNVIVPLLLPVSIALIVILIKGTLENELRPVTLK